MIYITGDCHGSETKFIENNMPGEDTWTADDKLIVCGDFGYVWYDNSYPEGKAYYDRLLDELERKPYDILFVAGNHEGYDQLYNSDEYKIVEKYGNKTRQIRRNIFHLQNGLIYTIEGKTFLAFGGAASIDKAYRLNYKHKEWWEQELPTEEEYDRCTESLKAVENKVDYIVTHTAPNEVLNRMNYYLPPQEKLDFFLFADDMYLRSRLDMIWYNIEFKRWFFGHWHKDIDIPIAKARALLNDVETIE